MQYSERVVAGFEKVGAAIGLAIGLAAPGCAGLSRTAAITSPLIGRWRQTGLGAGNESKPCPAQISVSNGRAVTCGYHDIVEFKADGTFAAKFSGGDIQAVGTWRIQDSTLLVTFTAPPEVAGIRRSTTIEFSGGGKIMSINAITANTPTVETYVRN